MRNTARLAAAGTLLTAAVFGPLSGTALAAQTSPSTSPSSLYAPSALTLTVARGESAATSTPERAVTLSCAPGASGTHPSSDQACGELRAAQGDFDQLPGHGQGFCTMEYNPVVVTAEGVWEGKRVHYERTFSNDCVRKSEGMSVFDF